MNHRQCSVHSSALYPSFGCGVGVGVGIVPYQGRPYQRMAYCLALTNQIDPSYLYFFRRHLATLASLERKHRKSWRASAIDMSCNNCLFTVSDPVLHVRSERQKIRLHCASSRELPIGDGQSIGWITSSFLSPLGFSWWSNIYLTLVSLALWVIIFLGGSIMADITIKEMIRSEQLQHQRKKKITFGPNHKIVI